MLRSRRHMRSLKDLALSLEIKDLIWRLENIGKSLYTSRELVVAPLQETSIIWTVPKRPNQPMYELVEWLRNYQCLNSCVHEMLSVGDVKERFNLATKNERGLGLIIWPDFDPIDIRRMAAVSIEVGVLPHKTRMVRPIQY